MLYYVICVVLCHVVLYVLCHAELYVLCNDMCMCCAWFGGLYVTVPESWQCGVAAEVGYRLHTTFTMITGERERERERERSQLWAGYSSGQAASPSPVWLLTRAQSAGRTASPDGVTSTNIYTLSTHYLHTI